MVEFVIENGAIIVENGAAVSKRMVDSAEDGDLAEYTNNGGDFAAVNVGSAARHGDWVIEYSTGGGAGANDSAISLSGLDRYPARGDVFGGYVYPAEDAHWARLYFGVQEDRNTFPHGYFVEADGINNELTLEHRNPSDTSQNVVIDSVAVDLTGWSDQWNEWQVDWASPTISATFYDDAGNAWARELSGDHTHDDTGGVGCAAETGTGSDSTFEVRFDWLWMR